MGTDWNRRIRGAEAFAQAYASTPPWDTGRPQRAIQEAADRGALTGHVLDAGCGTGEHALLAASRGLPATGVDAVPQAIEQARRKAAERGLAVRFEVGDVLQLQDLDETYDTVVDSGLYHALDARDIPAYVAELAAVVRPGGTLLVLCFSDQVPGDAGPRRVSQDELRRAFADGWTIEELADSHIEVAFGPVESVHAWRCTLRRVS